MYQGGRSVRQKNQGQIISSGLYPVQSVEILWLLHYKQKDMSQSSEPLNPAFNLHYACI